MLSKATIEASVAATGGDLPMIGRQGIDRHDLSIIYKCYNHIFRASAKLALSPCNS